MGTILKENYTVKSHAILPFISSTKTKRSFTIYFFKKRTFVYVFETQLKNYGSRLLEKENVVISHKT